MQKSATLVELNRCSKTTSYFQNSASIQPRPGFRKIHTYHPLYLHRYQNGRERGWLRRCPVPCSMNGSYGGWSCSAPSSPWRPQLPFSSAHSVSIHINTELVECELYSDFCSFRPNNNLVELRTIARLKKGSKKALAEGESNANEKKSKTHFNNGAPQAGSALAGANFLATTCYISRCGEPVR